MYAAFSDDLGLSCLHVTNKTIGFYLFRLDLLAINVQECQKDDLLKEYILVFMLYETNNCPILTAGQNWNKKSINICLNKTGINCHGKSRYWPHTYTWREPIDYYLSQ